MPELFRFKTLAALVVLLSVGSPPFPAPLAQSTSPDSIPILGGTRLEVSRGGQAAVLVIAPPEALELRLLLAGQLGDEVGPGVAIGVPLVAEVRFAAPADAAGHAVGLRAGGEVLTLPLEATDDALVLRTPAFVAWPAEAGN